MGVENGMFRSEIGSGFEDPGGTPPPRIPRSTPPGATTTSSNDDANVQLLIEKVRSQKME